MRLLPKAEVAKAKAIDRQREITEGMALAKKVDRLREVVVQEEQSLTQFREKTISELQDQIKGKTELRDALLLDVRNLEDRREKALEPLTVAWDELRRAEVEVGKEKQLYTRKHLELLAKEATLTNRERDLVKQENTIELLESDIRRRLSLAEVSKAKSDIELKQHRSITRDIEQRRHRLSNAEMDFNARMDQREASIKERELAIVKEKEALGKIRKQLLDREKTLTRNLKRQ